MNKLISFFYIVFCLLCISCQEKTIVSPDHLFFIDQGKTLLVTNSQHCELLKLASDMQTVEKKVVFPSPVNDIIQDNSGHLWVICDGNPGHLYELDNQDYTILSTMENGVTPSSMLFNPQSGTLWITQRYTNEVWEVNPLSREITCKIPVGREPVAIASFNNNNNLLIANNLPETSSVTFPVASQLDVVDLQDKKVIRRIPLPNGSTDVKAIATDASCEYAYVTHLLARYQLPTTQVDRGWMSTNVLSIIDLKACRWLTTVLLDTPQKGTANPWSVIVTPDDKQIIVAASGSHELVRIDRLRLHERLKRAQQGELVTPSMKSWDNILNDAGFLHGICDFISTGGKGPRSVVASGDKIYSANYYTGELFCMDLSGNKKVKTELGFPLTSTLTGKGEMYFHDATLAFQSWQSCASCHPNNARMDGLNWDLLNDGMGNPKNTKTLVLSHQTSPCMITGIRKDAETAVRSGIQYILFSQLSEEIAVAIDEYLKSLQPLSSPYLVNGKLSEAAQRGKVIFDKSCASCHSGIYYTDQKQYPVNWAVGPDKKVKMDVPALNECWRTAPYLYDGRSYSMKDMLKVHGPKEQVSEEALNDLAEYVLSL